jgi:MFS family permease
VWSAQRRALTLGLVLFGLGLLAGGLAPSMPVLVAARVVQGIGAGTIPAVGYVLQALLLTLGAALVLVPRRRTTSCSPFRSR